MENENAKQVVSKLVKDDLVMITACFDEYYFVIPEGLIKPHPVNAKIYQVGEMVPIKGESYEFPDDFNIIDLHFNMVAYIRDARLNDIITIEKYRYDGCPAVNMMGFAIKLSSQEDFDAFKAHYKTFKLSERSKLAAFANRWFEITEFRNIRYL
ncbi:MAG: hypothetical protein N2645_20780 [Clostridia bacterium]|nr:hypothetical protein [Clostridia bacterium]